MKFRASVVIPFSDCFFSLPKMDDFYIKLFIQIFFFFLIFLEIFNQLDFEFFSTRSSG